MGLKSDAQLRRRHLLAGGGMGAAQLLLGCGGGSSGPASAAPAPAAPAAGSDWAAVVDGITDTLQTLHVQPWGKVTQAAYLQAATALKTRINGLPTHLAAVECMALTALIGDGHTNLLTWNLHRWLPLALVQFSDGLFVAGASAAHSSLVGAQVLRIGNLDATTALTQAAKSWGAENAKAAMGWGQWMLSSGNVLRWAGATDDWLSAALTVRKPGASAQEVVTVAADNTYRFNPWDAPVTAAAQHKEFQRSAEPYWFEWVAGSRVFYLRYTECVDAARFAGFSQQLFAAFDAAKPRAVVVDLRGNKGGDSSVWQPFLAGLRTRATAGIDAGALRFVSDRFTFSAGVDAALDLLALGALHVGESPGQSPNFLGNQTLRALTALNIGMNYPTRVSNRVAGNPAELVPAIQLVRSSSDYFQGRDLALQRAMA